MKRKLQFTEHTHVPTRPCFEDDDHNDASDVQNTHGLPPSMLPNTRLLAWVLVTAYL